MANSLEAIKRRMALRIWISQDEGGYWFASTQPYERHGRKSTYVNWACRCPDCVLANTNTQGIRRNANRLATAAAERAHLFSEMSTAMVVGISRRLEAQEDGFWSRVVRYGNAFGPGGVVRAWKEKGKKSS